MIVGVLLAAGSGERFGGDKLLASLGDGTPIGVRSARVLRTAVGRSVAVVRDADAPLAHLLAAEGLDVLSFDRAADGLGSSLAFGVSRTRGADGWIVALADMPFVEASTFDAVRTSLEAGALIAAPSFRGRRGHPVGFASILYPELVRLSGDVGARALLYAHKEQVVLLECLDSGVLRDVDTPRDLL